MTVGNRSPWVLLFFICSCLWIAVGNGAQLFPSWACWLDFGCIPSVSPSLTTTASLCPAICSLSFLLCVLPTAICCKDFIPHYFYTGQVVAAGYVQKCHSHMKYTYSALISSDYRFLTRDIISAISYCNPFFSTGRHLAQTLKYRLFYSWHRVYRHEASDEETRY